MIFVKVVLNSIINNMASSVDTVRYSYNIITYTFTPVKYFVVNLIYEPVTLQEDKKTDGLELKEGWLLVLAVYFSGNKSETFLLLGTFQI